MNFMAQLAFKVPGQEEEPAEPEATATKRATTTDAPESDYDADGIPRCWPRVAFLPLNSSQAQRLTAAATAERAGKSEKRTVTCKGCGERGHNMRTCPAPK